MEDANKVLNTRRAVFNDAAIASVRPKSIYQKLSEKVLGSNSSPRLKSVNVTFSRWFPSIRVNSTAVINAVRVLKFVSGVSAIAGITTALYDIGTKRESLFGRGGVHLGLSILGAVNPWVGLGSLLYDVYLKDKVIPKF